MRTALPPCRIPSTTREQVGTNFFNYEKGAFSWIPFVYNEEGKSLKIGERRGEFPGMLAQRTFEIVRVAPDKPSGFDFTPGPEITVKYDGRTQIVNFR